MFETILSKILAERHVEGVVLLDSEGEASFAFSDSRSEDVLKIVGAYQAIILRCIGRLNSSDQKTAVMLFQNCTVLSHHLKDGYFLCIIFSKEVNFAYAQFALRKYYDSLAQEL